MLLSSLVSLFVCLFVGWSQEVAKMSNKIVLIKIVAFFIRIYFGRQIENRRPMFLSPFVSLFVCLFVGWSQEVEKMSNKLFL